MTLPNGVNIGDHVWCNPYNGDTHDYNHQNTWHHGILRSYSGNICNVDVRPSDRGKNPTQYMSSSYWVRYLKPYGIDIHMGTKVRQRCGRPAVIISYDNCEVERPITATITMADGTDRIMSYSKYGFFYKSQELPIDLVPIDT